MLTKAQFRTMVRAYIDDPSGKRWDTASLDIAIQMVLDDLWSDLLDQNTYLTSQLHTITSLISPGYIDLRLTTQGGQLTQRMYRIQSVKSNQRIYYPKDPRDILLTAGDLGVVVSSAFTWTVYGDQLWLFNGNTAFGDAPVDLRYSFRPTPYTSMSEGSTILFPEGSESAGVLTAAASTMSKGSVEDNNQMLALAEKSRQRMLNAVRKQSFGPIQPYVAGEPQEMGGI